MKSIYLFLMLIGLLTACKKPGSMGEPSPPAHGDSLQLKYTLTAFSPSKEFPDASLKALAYTGGTFSTVIGGATYKLGEQTSDADQKQCANSKEGQHLHLIIDNEPYVAKYESSFTYDIPDGEHYLLCFLSRSYHESIKTSAAHRAAKISVKDKSIKASEDISSPMLFYSRPKGLYTGDDTKKVMLDFYPINAPMPKYKVEADINGERHVIENWQPYYIEGLPEGENTIKLTLVDSNGVAVNTPLNPVTRKFQIEKTPAPK